VREQAARIASRKTGKNAVVDFSLSGIGVLAHLMLNSNS
jgi:hypothetical protein